MYYLLYTDKTIREDTYYRTKLSKRNKFRLDYLRESIGNNFKIHVDTKGDKTDKFVYSVIDLARMSANSSHGHNPFVLEVDDEYAVWAKLAHDQITKNNEKYGMEFNGTIGPFSKEDVKLAQYYKDEFINFNKMFKFFASSEYNTFTYDYDNTFPETMQSIEENCKDFSYGDLKDKLANKVIDFNSRMEKLKSIYKEIYADFDDSCDYFRKQVSQIATRNKAKIKEILNVRIR